MKIFIKTTKIFARLVKYFVLFLLWAKKINSKSIVFYSDPDLSDNSMAMFLYLNKIKPNDWVYIWVVDDIEKSKKILLKKLENTNNIKLLKKNNPITWVQTRFVKYQFDTHGAPYEKPFLGQRISVCLWHGSPLKMIGNSISPESFGGGQDITISAHEVFDIPLMDGLGISKNNIVMAGYPRNDLLEVGENKIYYRNYIVWMPTYASSVGSADGGGYKGRDSRLKSDSLGAMNFSELNELNKFFQEIGLLLVIKLHPYDERNNFNNELYSNIEIITNKHPDNFGLFSYELLAGASALISDCSSVVFDYMLTGRPIAIDVESLRNYVRPLLFDIINDNSSLYKISCIKDLMDFSLKISKNEIKTNYNKEKYNSDVEFNFCKKIAQKVNLV